MPTVSATKILLVEDHPAVGDENRGYQVEEAGTVRSAEATFRALRLDTVLNPLPVVTLVLALILQACSGPEEASKNTKAPKREYDWRASRYEDPACEKDPSCKQLKRIWEEGGVSDDAIRENFKKADTTVSFDQVEENPELYEGTPCAFKSTVVNVVGMLKSYREEYILAEIIVDDDPGKMVTLRGDFAADVKKGDQVYVVGYLTGKTYPRLGYHRPEVQGRKMVSMSARAILKPHDAMKYID